MSLPLFSNRLRRLDANDTIPRSKLKPSDIIDTKAFVPLLVGRQFAVAWNSDQFHTLLSKVQDEKKSNSRFVVEVTTLVIPKNCERISEISSDAASIGNELCQAKGTYKSLSLPLVTSMNVIHSPRDENSLVHYRTNHFCAVATDRPDDADYTGTGGEVCATTDNSVIIRWTWEDTDNTAQNDDAHDRETQDFLRWRFKRKSPVAMVSMSIPGRRTVWIPILANEHAVIINERLEGGLLKADNNVYTIKNLTYIDGPDIFIGECNFKPEGKLT